MSGIETLYLKVNPTKPEPEILSRAGVILREAGTVAFPTETVYGLGANALDEQAVAGIFRAKGRPSDNPLIVHIASCQDALGLVDNFPPLASKLAEAFWPGPLTMILPKNEKVPKIVTAGLDTVAIRMPEHPVALELIRAAGIPLAAPSANLSGKPSPTCAAHVWDDLQGRINALIDGGETRVGVESTVLDLSTPVPMILRPGGITREVLEALIGPVALDPVLAGAAESGQVPKAPGMKYTHYAPKADMVLVKGEPTAVALKIQQLAEESLSKGELIGIMATDENLNFYKGFKVLSVGSRQDLSGIAANIYGVLRNFDRLDVNLILAEALPDEGMGAAIMNRLAKAAGNQIIIA